MRNQGFMQKFITRLAFVLFLGTAYLPFSVWTARPALAICSCTICISPAQGMVQAQMQIYTGTFVPAVLKATAQVISYFAIAMGELTAMVIPEITLVTTEINTWIDSFWYYKLLPALETMTDQLSTMTVDQSRQIGSFMDAANMDRKRLNAEVHAEETHREQRPGESVALAETITGGMTRAAGFARAYNASAPTDNIPRSANGTVKVDGTPNQSSGGTGADMKERWTDHYAKYYCRKDDNNGASGCAADQPFAGQDIDVTGTIFSKDTIDLKNADIKRTVDDLIINIAEPFVKDPAPAKTAASATGQQMILEAEAYKAKRQVIYDALYHVVARRAPGSRMQAFVKPLRDAAGLPPGVLSDDPSQNEIMQAMMSERFRTGQYALGQIDEPENNAREMVIQQAFQLMQMSDQLDLMDRYALLLAAQVGAEVRQDKFTGTAVESAPLK